VREWTERPAADHSLNEQTMRTANIFLGAPNSHFDPGKTLNVYMGLIMINPQKPVINLITFFNRFTALIKMHPILCAKKHDPGEKICTLMYLKYTEMFNSTLQIYYQNVLLSTNI